MGREIVHLPCGGIGRGRRNASSTCSPLKLAAMRNLLIPALVLLPSLAGIAHAAQERRPDDAGQRRQQEVSLTPGERSVTYSGCREIRARGVADGFACAPVRR